VETLKSEMYLVFTTLYNEQEMRIFLPYF